MSSLNIEEVHKKLTERIKEYIKVIAIEYGKYMPEDNLKRLNNISDYNKILKIYDYGEVNAYANKEHVYMPLCADKLLNNISKFPLYGISKNHRPYNSENMIINDNTYLTYVKYIFISGTDAEGYYEDTLLHEVMHFCGSGGGSVIEEGTNELLTRMLAQKYNLRTSSCGYPKEVKLSYKLMECFGEENITRLAFINGFTNKLDYLKDNLGERTANLYLQVSRMSEKEFDEKYYSHMKDFKGIIGIAKKVLFYNKIDYSKVYKAIDEYNNSLKVEAHI